MLNKKLATISAGLLMGASSLTHAAVNQTGWTLTGLGQVTFASDTDRRNTDDGVGVRLGLSHPIGSWLVVEGLLSYQEFDTENAALAPITDEYSAGIDLQFHFLPDLGPIHPYLISGFGGVRTADLTAPNLYTNDGYVDFGLGFDIPFNRWGLSLTTDVKHRSIFWDELRGRRDPNEWQVGLGLSLDLSGPTQVVVINDAGAAPTDGDSDGDGVPDSLDRCPGSPAGTPVDAYGCPAAADSDGDGVSDASDRCPNTPRGQAVGADGCPAPETVVIYFAFDSAELNGPARAALNAVADNLKARSFVVAIANGHADRTGTDSYNMALSEKRAKAVANYLTSRGVGADQIRTRAFGETRPLNDGATAEDRARNRRVEINLLKQ